MITIVWLNHCTRLNTMTDTETNFRIWAKRNFVGACIKKIGDYKTTGKKPNIESIPWGYKTQLLSYAYSLRAEGITIDRIRLVWVVKSTKTLPVRLFVVNLIGYSSFLKFSHKNFRRNRCFHRYSPWCNFAFGLEYCHD